MSWIVNNWSFLVVIVAVLVIVSVYLKKFASLPTDEQITKIREWLLYAVIEAEKEYQSGTGRLKLVAVYSQFCQIFPNMVTIISLEMFSRLVDDALVEMRKILETNKDIEAYVKGD